MPERWTMRDGDAYQHDGLDRSTPGGSGRFWSRAGRAFNGSFFASFFGSRVGSSYGSIWPLAPRAIEPVVAGDRGDFGDVEIFSLKGISS